MRRTTPFLAVGLAVLGLELSTKAASLTAVRLSSGFQALVDGLESFVSPTRFVAGVSLLTMGLIVGGVQMMLENAEGRVSAVGDTCPVCGRDTERLKRKSVHHLLSKFMGRPSLPTYVRHGARKELE